MEKEDEVKVTIGEHEAFWVDRLGSSNQIELPFARNDASRSASESHLVTKPLRFHKDIAGLLRTNLPDWTADEFMLAAFVAFLSGLTGRSSFDLGLEDLELDAVVGETASQFARVVPMSIDVGDAGSFSNLLVAVRTELRCIRQNKTYALDVFERHPSLEHVSSAIREQRWPVAVELVEGLARRQRRAIGDFTMVIGEDPSECTWTYDTAKLDGDKLANSATHFGRLVVDLAREPVRGISILAEPGQLAESGDAYAAFSRHRARRHAECRAAWSPYAAALALEEA